jgi:hypothetical protein
MVIAEVSTGSPTRSEAMLGFRHGATENHVFDLAKIHLRHACERTLDGDGRKIVGTAGAQRAFVGAANGRANTRCNYHFTHVLVSRNLICKTNSTKKPSFRSQ